jgi:hypothetical protein
MLNVKCVVAAMAVAASAGLAQGGIVTAWDFGIQASDGSTYQASANPMTWSASLNMEGSTVIEGAFETDGWMIEFDLVFNNESCGLVTSNYELTNFSSGTLGFTIATGQFLVNPALNQMRGSISGSIGDNTLLPPFGEGDGATAGAFQQNPLYQAIIDLGPVQTLHNPFLGVTALPNGTEVVPTQDFGIPVFIPAPGVNLGMAIRNDFTITADDSIGLQSTFKLVPTPGAAALFGLAGLAGIRRRR